MDITTSIAETEPAAPVAPNVLSYEKAMANLDHVAKTAPLAFPVILFYDDVWYVYKDDKSVEAEFSEADAHKNIRELLTTVPQN